MGETKPFKSTTTKLERIAKRSSESEDAEFRWLMPLFNVNSLTECFHELDGKKAVGIDGKSKDEYGRTLRQNIEALVERMKRLAYKPAPCREVLIPKNGQRGKFRPLGISNIEDKIVQSMFNKILTAIYEPIFLPCSFGFRPKKSCHDAVGALRNYAFNGPCVEVIDVDLENFFGSLDHGTLIKFLKHKIKDQVFVRFIARMLKAGCLSREGLRRTDYGSPQGNIASPILANIYAHYAIDLWFERIVKKHLMGPAALFRYCDDFVICTKGFRDTNKILKALENRLTKFYLRINKDKTKVVPFSCNKARIQKQGSFDFLGFTFYMARCRRGIWIPKVKTSKKSYRTKLRNVTEWCRNERHNGSTYGLWIRFCSKLRGHANYYGVSFNIPHVNRFFNEAEKIFFKWMNRRSQRKSIKFSDLDKIKAKCPMPRILVYHSLYKPR